MVLAAFAQHAWRERRIRRDAPAPRQYPVMASVVPMSANDRRYSVTLENRTGFPLVDGSVDMRWILHPGKFSGLDDTHMPADIWVPAPIRFAALAPGERQTFEVDGYAPAREYDGPKLQRAALVASRAAQGSSTAPEKWDVQVLMTWVR